MSAYFHFGERVKEYDIPVFNERELRAGAGLFFLFAISAFFHAMYTGSFVFLRVYIIAFFTDFFIRMFVNPQFAPMLILGRLIVHNQKVEYTGAPQKRWAWGIGIILSTYSLITVVLLKTWDISNIIVCIFCLTALFCESAFGICIGCKLYNLFHKQKAHLCPGGVCEVFIKEEIQKVHLYQILFFIAFLFYITLAYILIKFR